VTRLLLVRHGETEWNKEGRYHGVTDVELSKVGLEQARRLSQRLAKEKPDALYSSPLKRAMQTAQQIAEVHNMSIVPRDELRELNLGDFEGKRFRGAGDEGRPLEAAWEVGNVDFTPPGGETLYQLHDRVAGFLSALGVRHSERTVLIVSHGGTLRVMICHLMGIELKYWWRLRIESGALSIVEVRPEGAVLLLLNDTCRDHVYLS
jgi:broad specificity phosphatase PhoE